MRCFDIISGISFVFAILYCIYYIIKKKHISFVDICIIILFFYQVIDITKETWVDIGNNFSQCTFIADNWNALFSIPIDLILISYLIKSKKTHSHSTGDGSVCS